MGDISNSGQLLNRGQNVLSHIWQSLLNQRTPLNNEQAFKDPQVPAIQGFHCSTSFIYSLQLVHNCAVFKVLLLVPLYRSKQGIFHFSLMRHVLEIWYRETSEQRTSKILKNLSVISRCPLLGGSLRKIATSGTKDFVRYSRHIHYWEVSRYQFLVNLTKCYLYW